MDIIEICPPKNLRFVLPNDLHRTLTITNLTLRSLYICVLKSHDYELSLSQDRTIMSAFEELKINLTLNLNQHILNSALAKLRIYYFEIDDDAPAEQIEQQIFANSKAQYEEINILYDIDSKTDTLHVGLLADSEERQFVSQDYGNKAYLMRRQYPKGKLGKSAQREKLKNEILNYLQQLEKVLSIEECEKNECFLIEFKDCQPDTCNFVTFTVEEQSFVYSIARIIAYGSGYSIPTLVSIESEEQISKSEPQKEKQPAPQQTIIQPQKVQQPVVDKKKKDLVKQSFAMKRQGEKVKTKRRNKSQEKIQQKSSDEEEDDLQLRKQLRNFRLADNFDVKVPEVIKIRHEIKINQTNIQLSEKVLNVLIDKKENMHLIYVLLRDCVRVFMLEDPSYKRVLKFDPIDAEHISMPCPIDIYKDQLIFGNESYLFWVNTVTGYNQWKYVQRKYIYTLAIIDQLSLVALGGKNFSKLSYFGKETSRSNIKLYSCSASDKHDHLFTYDIPGNNVGHVINMDYISVPPHGTKLLLLQTVNSQSNKTAFFFLRIKAFNKIEVYCELELDELGILNLLKFKHNKETGRVVCMQALGDTHMDTFKKLKVKCQYEKVQVSTQGFKFPLKRFISFHLGGSKDGCSRQWMSFVQQNGSIFHIFDFQSSKLQTFQLGKGQIRQVFPLYNGKFLIICSQSSVKIREKVQIQIKE